MVASNRFDLHVLADFIGRNMLDVCLTCVELIDLEFVEIETRHSMAHIGKTQREREPDVAATDDPDLEVLPCKKLRLALGAHPFSSPA